MVWHVKHQNLLEFKWKPQALNDALKCLLHKEQLESAGFAVNKPSVA